MARTVFVVPHCHWDREWYQPHELFRWRLVQMIDELLDHMEQHPEYTCFNLDGRSIVIDDYLELRPENEGRLRAMIESGRIVIGPWWVQPDEFLPKGESHIRSFQKGIRFAERLGAAGVPAYMVLRPSDLYENPQLAHRGFFVTLDHAVMGPTPYDGPVTHFSGTPAILARPAPALGQHTHEILHDLLGYTQDEIAALAEAGVLT